MESNKASLARRTTSLPLYEAQERAHEFNAIILGEYKKASEKVLLRCLNCHNEWNKSIASLSFSRVGCPVCALQKSANDRRKSEPEVAEILSNLGIDYLGGYTSSHSTLAVKFRACGHTSTDQRFSVLRRGFGCAICYHVNLNDYLSLAENYKGSLLSAGTNSTSLSSWRCVNGCIFERSYASIKAANNFCSICSKGISERICQVAFSQVFGVKFKKVKLTNLRGSRGGVLEFDLYAEIGDKKVAVEHQGSHHYQPRTKHEDPKIFERQLEHDSRKRKYAIKNNIYLFEIPELFSQTGLSELKSVIRSESVRVGCEMPVNFEFIDLDLSPAFNSSNAKQAYDELIIFCASVGYKLEDAVFMGSAEPHNFCCEKGHKIRMRPASLINGSRCLECYKESSWLSIICTNGKVYEAANKAAVDLKVDTGSVHSALKNKHFVGGYLVAVLSRENYKKFLENPRHLDSILLDLKHQENERRRYRMPLVTSDGKLYLSQSAAAIDFNCKPSQVSAALSRNDSTINGVGVVDLTEEKYYELMESAEKLSNFVASKWSQPPKRNQSKRKSVASSDGNLFDSVGSCAAFLGVSISCISSKITSGKPINGVTLKFSDRVA